MKVKKAVSIAVFGENHAKYAVNLPAFVLGHLNVFPIAEGWKLHVHVDDDVYHSRYGAFLRALSDVNLVAVTRMEKAPLTYAMLWRLFPAFLPDVEFTFARDLDAPPMPRDRACCEHFMASGLDVHTVHDNVAHAGVMGGLSGYYGPGFREVTGFQTLWDLYAWCEKWKPDWAMHGTDQVMLNRLICASGGPTLFEHRFNGWTAGQPGVGPKRKAGSYPCRGMSAPVPDKGWRLKRLYSELQETADRLGNHLGCAGYDLNEAERFWLHNGDQNVATTVEALRRDAGL